MLHSSPVLVTCKFLRRTVVLYFEQALKKPSMASSLPLHTTGDKLRLTTPEEGLRGCFSTCRLLYTSKIPKARGVYDFELDDKTKRIIPNGRGLSLRDRPGAAEENPPQWNNTERTNDEGFRRSFVYRLTSPAPGDWEIYDDGWQNRDQFYHFSLRPTTHVQPLPLEPVDHSPLKRGSFIDVDNLEWVPVCIVLARPLRGASDTLQFENPDVAWCAAALHHVWSKSSFADESFEACAVLNLFGDDASVEFGVVLKRLLSNDLKMVRSALDTYLQTCASCFSDDVECTLAKVEGMT